jgi:hypothetical protein
MSLHRKLSSSIAQRPYLTVVLVLLLVLGLLLLLIPRSASALTHSSRPESRRTAEDAAQTAGHPSAGRALALLDAPKRCER